MLAAGGGSRRETGRTRSTALATLLSFLFPGLGQLYDGRPRAAAVYAVPMLVVLLLLWLQLTAGADIFAIRLLVPSFAMTVLVVVLVTGAWRLLSIADAFQTVRPTLRSQRGGSRIRQPGAWRMFLVVVAAVVLMHGVMAAYAWDFYEAGSKIFVGHGDGFGDVPTPTPGPTPAPGDTPTPSPVPPETPAPAGRINILLTGRDSGLGYPHALNDTIMVVTVDPNTNTGAMISLPRDIAQFPLYDGGTYSDKINSLMSYAEQNPRRFKLGGIATLEKEVSFLLGVPIHYYAVIDLAGFKKMVDAAGGVDIVVERPIADYGYQFPDGKVGFFLSAGPHHLDGRLALAFVRTRNSAGDNDFTRAARQQQLLVAMRTKIVSPQGLAMLPDLLAAAAQTIRTDLPGDSVPDLVQLARQVTDQSVQHYVLGPPYAVHPPDSETGGIYILRLNMQKVAQLSVAVFGEESAYYVPSPSPSVGQ